MITPLNRTGLDGQDEFECLDPDLGEQLWRREEPECPTELFERLEAHLTYCAYCRLQVAVEERTVAGLREGRLRVTLGSGRGGRIVRWAAGTGAMALAAGLALILLLPPRAPHEDMVMRGEGQPGIDRPVPGEVVLGGRPEVRWTELEGANRYNVEISMVGGDHSWSTTTEDAAVAIPEGMDLPVGARYRVNVAPVPGHVAPDGALRSSFRTGGGGQWIGYRLERGAPAGRLVGLAGGLVLIVAGLVGWWGRRHF